MSEAVPLSSNLWGSSGVAFQWSCAPRCNNSGVFVEIASKPRSCSSHRHCSRATTWSTVRSRNARKLCSVMCSSLDASSAGKASGGLEEHDERVVRDISGNVAVDTLVEFWAAVCSLNSSSKSELVVRIPPGSAFDDPRQFERVANYITECSDCCDMLGSDVFLTTKHPALDDDNRRSASPELVLKRGADNDFGFGDDDDDDWEIDLSILDKYKEADDAKEALAEGSVGDVPVDDEDVMKKTFAWVQSVVVELGVCPFTSSSAARAGVPMGDVRYQVDRASNAEHGYAAYWREVQLLLSERDERKLSTTLLIVPELFHKSADAFDAFSATLTSALTSLTLEKDLQLVFFHPQYCFRDGASRFGSNDGGGESAETASSDTAAANYARRSPWGMINLLRTGQVRAAQRVIPTGLVYRQNETTLQEIGSGKLEQMLRKRDWAPLKNRPPVDRRTNPVFAAADDFRRQQDATADSDIE
uniref:Uncharacterized protein n=1 Tax=Erythrolobus madagascarensis TaxID=708628 RepID=A0A7S0T487_9RHOD|mmetsp:Transcript_2296/g.5171  ORF Transcript_2296/g.5171 Transcript_2296/m.5171 type:complete len:474 (+) Transcript_2296:61-1482(+)